MGKNIYLKKIKNDNLLTQDNLTYHNLQATFLWGWQHFFLELNAPSYEFPDRKKENNNSEIKQTWFSHSFCDMVKLYIRPDMACLLFSSICMAFSRSSRVHVRKRETV